MPQAITHQPISKAALSGSFRAWGVRRGKLTGWDVAVFSVLRHEEAIRLDPACLIEMYARLGEDCAERMIGLTMEELAGNLTEVDRHALAGDLPALIRCAERLSLAARDIGMTTLARVAGDVIRATIAGDAAGRSATVARLARIGDRSFAAIWDIRDVSL